MHYENISKLMDNTKESVTNGRYMDFNQSLTSYFAMDLRSGSVLSKQTAVIRTNCIDCLDRMN